MNIEITFTLSAGNAYKNSTSDFASLDDCQQTLAGLLGQENGSITFAQPGGSRVVMATRHIVAVELAAGGR